MCYKLFMYMLVVILALLGCTVNPVTQEREFILMSQEQEISLGKELYPQYTQLSYGLYQDERLQSYVQNVGQKVVAKSDRPGLPYEFNVVNDSNVNAYALPGGKISITRGLISHMENEAQLAAVLAHEVGHVAARHAAQGYTRNVLAGLVTGIAASALKTSEYSGADLLIRSGQLISQMVLMKYSRDQERQADRLSIEYMARAGYNPEGMIQVAKLLKDLNERRPSMLEVMFSTHPPGEERFETAKQLVTSYSTRLRDEAFLYEEDFEEATRDIERTKDAYAKMDKALKLAQKKELEQAQNLLSQATQMAPNQALIWAMQAAIQGEKSRYESAYSSAKQSVSLYSDLFYARYISGLQAFKLKKYQESLAHLEKAQSLLPNIPEVLFYQGRNFEYLGQQRRAAEAYKQVLQKVNKGEMAEYCYRRLKQWGYI